MNGPAYLKSWLDAIDGDEKFVMTIGAGMVNTVLLCFAFISADIYLALTTGTVIAYITGKTIENVKANRSAADVQIAATRSD